MLTVLTAMICSPAQADGSPFVVDGPSMVTTEVVDSSRHVYTIALGGTVDMDNTTTRGCGSYEVAFQPNVSLAIENTGDTPVVDPWIVINGLRDWRNIDTVLAEATRGATSDQEKLYLIYEFARSHRYHDHPLFVDAELHDPVKHFNCYGAGLCDDMGSVTCSLAHHAGLTKERHGADPVNRAMHGHVMCEIPVGGQLQFIDTDENAFYLDPDNDRPVSGDEIVRDSDLAAREHAYGPLFDGWGQGENASALLGRDDGQYRSITIGHEMHLTLRPGEKLTYRWDNVGKCPGEGTLKYFGNSALDYTPALTEAGLQQCADSQQNISAQDGAIAGSTRDGALVVRTDSPYVVCGGQIEAGFSCSSDGDQVAVDVSADGAEWKPVWQQGGRGQFGCDVQLDDALAVKGKEPRYSYLTRIRLASSGEGTCRLTSFHIHTDLLASPIALPRLRLGKNSVVYTDATEGPHRVRITHTYQESGNLTPPPPPELLYPANGAVSRDAAITFRWADVPKASKYHLRVSRRPDMRVPYRPAFDVVVSGTSHGSPYTGLFNPGETYYWRTRTRDENGVWGDWSPIRTFAWNGPRPPVDVAYTERDGELWLTWQPNPRGNQPVAYEVYASDQRGFRPTKEAHQVKTIGEVPPTFVGHTTATEYLIVSGRREAPNRSSYRVIAIDANGTPSGSSWPVELPHPHVFSTPVAQATIDRPYEYRVETLRCDGDLQYRYQKPGYGFWEREGYEFEVVEGPTWLQIDPETGVLSGTPQTQHPGESTVKVRVRRTWPDEVKKDQHRPEYFLKDGPEYQAEAVQAFTLLVRDE